MHIHVHSAIIRITFKIMCDVSHVICLMPSLAVGDQALTVAWDRKPPSHPKHRRTKEKELGGHVSRPKNNNGLSGLFAYMIQQNHRALTRQGPEIAVPLQDSLRHGEGAWETRRTVGLLGVNRSKWGRMGRRADARKQRRSDRSFFLKRQG